jgi:hypothetical protein
MIWDSDSFDVGTVLSLVALVQSREAAPEHRAGLVIALARVRGPDAPPAAVDLLLDLASRREPAPRLICDLALVAAHCLPIDDMFDAYVAAWCAEYPGTLVMRRTPYALEIAVLDGPV